MSSARFCDFADRKFITIGYSNAVNIWIMHMMMTTMMNSTLRFFNVLIAII